jgi:hypothetical protein
MVKHTFRLWLLGGVKQKEIRVLLQMKLEINY